MLKIIHHFLLLCILIMFGVNASYAVDSMIKYIPLPLVELKDVVGGWFVGGRFKTTYQTNGESDITLTAQRGEEQWQVQLMSLSPLMTKVKAQVTSDRPEEVVLNKLWEYLAVYTNAVGEKTELVTENVPGSVLEKRNAVIILYDKENDRQIQFTGFFFGPDGLIISIAHDIEDFSSIFLKLHNQAKYPVDMLKLDKEKDLSLMKTDYHPDHYITLDRISNQVTDDKKLYAVGNPLDVQGMIVSGMVYGGKRLLEGLPLWQLEMRVYPGSSGSPVFDNQGHFVGVVKGRHRTIPSVTYMIPVETVQSFLEGATK